MMHDVIAYILIVALFCLGVPTGITIERIRLRRAMKKHCPEALEILHAAGKI